MSDVIQNPDTERYARCITASQHVRWDIESDVIRGRRFGTFEKYLPDGLSLVQELSTFSEEEKRLISRIQGRTYANIFGLVERFINAKVLEISRDHWLGDQVALQALVGFSDQELKHQALFRRINDMIGETLPSGYRFDIDPDMVATAVLGKSTWAVLALTLDIELFTQLHYRQSIEPDGALSELFKDVFLFHWKEESQHAILDELELKRHHAGLTVEERDRGVDDFIALVAAVDGILQAQAKADAQCFRVNRKGTTNPGTIESVENHFLKAYRWQYIFSGAAHPRFQAVLGSLISEVQGKRIETAIATLQ